MLRRRTSADPSGPSPPSIVSAYAQINSSHSLASTVRGSTGFLSDASVVSGSTSASEEPSVSSLMSSQPSSSSASAPRSPRPRSEEHRSELQSLMRLSYAVFCLNKKNERTVRKKQKIV